MALALSGCGATERNGGEGGDTASVSSGTSGSNGGASGSNGGASSVGGGTSDASGGASIASGGVIHIGSVGGGGGTGGAAGSPPMGSDRVRYTACDWAETQDDVTRVKVARWDDALCTCTVAFFERVDACPTEVDAEGWCMTGARQTEDSADCESGFGDGVVPLAAFGKVEGLESGIVSVELELDFESNAVQGHVRIESERCLTNCSLDCEAPAGSYPGLSLPSERAVFVTHACDHYDVWLYSPVGFYVGALDWVLAIGETRFSLYRYSGTAIVFAIPDGEFEALDDGAAVMSGYGAPDTVFGYLDKSNVL